jgi:hypothetical protein
MLLVAYARFGDLSKYSMLVDFYRWRPDRTHRRQCIALLMPLIIMTTKIASTTQGQIGRRPTGFGATCSVHCSPSQYRRVA